MAVEKSKINYKLIFATRKKLLASIVIVLVCLGIIFFGFIPQLQAGLDIKNEYDTELPRLENLRKKLINLESVQVTPEFQQRELVDTALPSKKPLLELMTSLNSIALSTDIDIDDFSLSPGEIATQSGGFAVESGRSNRSSSAVDTLEVSLNVSGSIDAVQEFLVLLEKITPFTTITQLAVETSERNGEQLMSARIDTETYFYTQSITADIDSALPTVTQSQQEILQQLSSFVENDLPEQTEIRGGVEDVFQVDGYDFENADF